MPSKPVHAVLIADMCCCSEEENSSAARLDSPLRSLLPLEPSEHLHTKNGAPALRSRQCSHLCLNVAILRSICCPCCQLLHSKRCKTSNKQAQRADCAYTCAFMSIRLFGLHGNARVAACLSKGSALANVLVTAHALTCSVHQHTSRTQHPCCTKSIMCGASWPPVYRHSVKGSVHQLAIHNKVHEGCNKLPAA